MKSVLFFDAMFTPKVINFIYWLALLAVLISGIGLIISGSFLSGLGMLLGGAILTRVYCEILIVIFKIHENLKKIADRSE